MKLKLVANKKHWIRSWSAQLAGAAGIIGMANEVVAVIAGAVPYRWVQVASTVLALLAVVARGIHQPELHDGDDK